MNLNEKAMTCSALNAASLVDEALPMPIASVSSESRLHTSWISLSYTLNVGQRINHEFKKSFIEIHYPSYQGS